MLAVALILACQFDAMYHDFIRSPRSGDIYDGLSHGRYTIDDFSHDPFVLWYWRNVADDPRADTLLARMAIRRNFYLSAVLRWEAKEAGDYTTAMNKLYLASHFDTSAIENFLSFLSLAARTRKADPFLSALSLPVLADLRTQIFLLANAIILVFLAVFMSAFVYITAKTVFYLPLLSHRIDPQGHTRLKGIIGLAILLLPALILRSPFWILVAYGMILVFVLGTRERNWLRAILAILIIGFVFSAPLRNMMDFLMKKSRNYELYELVHYDNNLIIQSRTDTERMLEAYARKQRGDLEKSMFIYEEMYYKGHRDITVVNNLANIYMIYGEDARAETLYQYVMRAGKYPEPFFNMGLLKLRSLEYSESSRYMAEARRRGFSSSSTVPLDIMPATGAYYTMLLSEDMGYLRSINPLLLIAFALVFVLTFIPLRFPLPYYCSACGRAICHKCQEEPTADTTCKECFMKLKATENVKVEAQLRHSVARHTRRARKITAYFLNILVPGSGLIYLERHLAGLAVAFITMLACIPLLMPGSFIRPAGWVCLPMTPVLLTVALVVAFLAYLYSFLSIRNYHGD